MRNPFRNRWVVVCETRTLPDNEVTYRRETIYKFITHKQAEFRASDMQMMNDLLFPVDMTRRTPRKHYYFVERIPKK